MGDDESDALVGEDHAESGSGNGQDERFGEQLANDAAAAGSDCGANGKFMLAGGAACQQQDRDIAAADGQQQCDSAKKHIKSFADSARYPMAQVLELNFLEAILR